MGEPVAAVVGNRVGWRSLKKQFEKSTAAAAFFSREIKSTFSEARSLHEPRLHKPYVPACCDGDMMISRNKTLLSFWCALAAGLVCALYCCVFAVVAVPPPNKLQLLLQHAAAAACCCLVLFQAYISRSCCHDTTEKTCSRRQCLPQRPARPPV